jgi:hypothetical protein
MVELPAGKYTVHSACPDCMQKATASRREHVPVLVPPVGCSCMQSTALAAPSVRVSTAVPNGNSVGAIDGTCDMDGCSVGLAVGWAVGWEEGQDDGSPEGFIENEGELDGTVVGR